MSLDPGTKLGPFEIQSLLGAGGMGEVYRARDSRLDRTVAIKVLPSDLAANPESRQRLEREARSISKLSHPHICALYDVGHQDETDFLVMEYVEGETLEQRLSRGPLSIEQVLKVAIEICDALDGAHQQGVIHRDLKPGNIMLTRSGAKLLDFGLAKLMYLQTEVEVALTEITAERKLTAEGVLVGTLQYMAPEQLEGKDADARTDIFALAEITYEMATGRSPFTGKSKASLIAAILSTEPPEITTLQPMIPATLNRVVKACLAKDPANRFQTAHDLTSAAMGHGCQFASGVAGSSTGSGKTARASGVGAGCAVAYLGCIRDQLLFSFFGEEANPHFCISPATRPGDNRVRRRYCWTTSNFTSWAFCRLHCRFRGNNPALASCSGCRKGATSG